MSEPELIKGHKGIARFLGLTPRQVAWHDEQGNLPTFRIGRTVFARRSKLLQWLDDLEEQNARRANG